MGEVEVPAGLTHGGNVGDTVDEGGLVFLEEALDLRDFWVRGELSRVRRGREARVVRGGELDVLAGQLGREPPGVLGSAGPLRGITTTGSIPYSRARRSRRQSWSSPPP